uniref:FOXP coiled-coil domain-containing protein n=1 Tax=Eptatretus burgeri TaxID=7764 RepID=A0A8C4RAH8_EPTBU
MAAGSGGSTGRGEDGGTTKNGAVDVSVSTPTSASASATQSPVHSLMLNGKMSSHRESARDESSRHSLYRHGTCKWPGCEAICDSYSDFLKHLNSDHALDDRSTAQCRVQMQVVQQLEIQLGKEQQRLQAMTAHLQAKQGEPKPSVHPLNMTAAGILGKLTMESTSLSVPRSPSNTSGGLGAAGLSGLTVLTPASMQAMQAVGPARRRSTERYSSLSSDIAQNQEFYKNAEVRPAIHVRIAHQTGKYLHLSLSLIFMMLSFCSIAT